MNNLLIGGPTCKLLRYPAPVCVGFFIVNAYILQIYVYI